MKSPTHEEFAQRKKLLQLTKLSPTPKMLQTADPGQAKLEAIKLLFVENSSLKVDCADEKGTPLFYAVRAATASRDLRVVKFLLEQKADVNKKIGNNPSPYELSPHIIEQARRPSTPTTPMPTPTAALAVTPAVAVIQRKSTPPPAVTQPSSNVVVTFFRRCCGSRPAKQEQLATPVASL